MYDGYGKCLSGNSAKVEMKSIIWSVEVSWFLKVMA